MCVAGLSTLTVLITNMTARWLLSSLSFCRPVVDVLYPEASMPAAERTNVYVISFTLCLEWYAQLHYSAFSSFPDSSIFETGSEVHSFRIRYSEAFAQRTGSSTSLSESKESDGFLYGFSLFHQRKDASSKRGYLQVSLCCSHKSCFELDTNAQRSVVILSYHPLPSLFTACLAELAPMYFSKGAPTLEAACHNIANW